MMQNQEKDFRQLPKFSEILAGFKCYINLSRATTSENYMNF